MILLWKINCGIGRKKKKRKCGGYPVERVISPETIIILVSSESGYSQFGYYTPKNRSSKCIATPPTIRRTHPTTGIADIPNTLLIADSPIQPKNPNTIIMVGGSPCYNYCNKFFDHFIETSVETVFPSKGWFLMLTNENLK